MLGSPIDLQKKNKRKEMQEIRDESTQAGREKPTFTSAF